MTDEDIAALIPHQGTMCLLERVLHWDAQRVLVSTTTHRSPDNPLRRGNRLRALHLCEYGAQAAAVHGGLSARHAGTQARPGLLVSLRDIELNRDYIEDLAGDLLIEAEQLMQGQGSWQYAFRVHHVGEEIARGRVAIMARSQRG